MGNLASNEKKKVVAMVLEWSNSARKSIKTFYKKLTLVTLVNKVLTLPFLGRRDSQRRDDIE